MILALTDFAKEPYKIPNQSESSAWLSSFVGDTEEEILKSLLGIDLYTTFTTELAGTPAQKWIDLRDGKTYTYNGITNEWAGMVKMLVPAVYSLWLPINMRRATSSGVVVNKGQQNTEVQTPVREIVTSWNRFVDYSGYKYSEVNSLYGFLKAKETDYSDEIDTFWTAYNKQNSFNI